jgi:hypothetical protein
MKENHYSRLLIMTGLSFVAMYILMYAMVDSFGGAYNNLNQAYMAGLMAAPMVPIELTLMRSLYHDRRMNLMFFAGAVAIGAVPFVHPAAGRHWRPPVPALDDPSPFRRHPDVPRGTGGGPPDPVLVRADHREPTD